VKVLSIQPVLKGYGFHPLAGGKDKAASEITRVFLEEGHEVDLLAFPWDHRMEMDETFETGFSLEFSEHLPKAEVLPTLFMQYPESRRKQWASLLNQPGAWRNPMKSTWTNLRRSLKDKRVALRKALEGKNYAAIVVHQSASDLPLLARKFGYTGPMYLIHHSPGLSPFVSCYDHVVFVSQYQREQALSLYPDLRDRSSVIHYFVEPVYQQEIQLQSNKDVLFIGLLEDDRKGLNHLLKAYEEVEALSQWKLQVVGEGKRRKAYESHATEMHLPVSFHGRLSDGQNVQLMEESSCFVMPSRAEGLAIVYLEAVNMGLPIVGFTPNVQEISSILGMTVGIGFDPDYDSPSDLARYIQEVVDGSDPYTAEHRTQMGHKARHYFSKERFHDDYQQLIRTFSKT